MGRIVLHAGLPKTGSTSIQQFLDANSAALAAQGFMYEPAADRPSRRDHNFLAMAFWKSVQRIYADRYGTDLERLRADSLHAWHDQLAAFRSSDRQTLLISGEMFTRCAVPRLGEFVRAEMPDDEVSVLFYLRRPSALYVSWLQQHLKGSNTMLPFSRSRARWAKRLRLFQKEIGEVVVREFARSTLLDGDVVFDFARTVGIDDAGLVRPPNANESVSAEGMDLLVRHRRRHYPDAPNRILPETVALLQRIQKAEAELRDVDFTPPALRPELAGYLDSDVDELVALERRFGFTYAGIGSASAMDAAADDLEGVVFDTVGEMMTLDEQALAALRERLERAGVTF